MSNLKVEGKVGDFCLKCKNCKAVTRMYDGKNRIIEVDCEDPYDGMIKTLTADSDVCCSMFEPKPDRSCEKCISKGNDIDHLLSENKEKDNKISELEERVKYWSNIAAGNTDKLINFKRERDKWRKLYNSLSEICSDYDKRCKEECEKKYRDEISKLQNIVTEKEVEIKGLRKDNTRLNKDISWGNMIAEKNTELNQTISDQEITIKALLITIKEMCKDER